MPQQQRGPPRTTSPSRGGGPLVQGPQLVRWSLRGLLPAEVLVVRVAAAAAVAAA
eukprot:CAMPEP_0171970782 /NCGR_PEP_ID=MMETSP0993-20121228/214482_1 /TAXON_ID=483369 /ORGANISM="non described non described, Strain CCMP2098" /LENGTH=54 /DNA_ID=CAMNT_0012620949 /DNA_START=51 /DNA_END=212 /DNA_ORIENTATION=+